MRPRTPRSRLTERVAQDVMTAALAAPCDACRDGDVDRCRCGLGRGIVDGATVRYVPTEAAPPRESVTYVVEGDPFWDNDYAQRTGNPPRAVVRLVYAEDVGKPPSRQRFRSGYVDELAPARL